MLWPILNTYLCFGLYVTLITHFFCLLWYLFFAYFVCLSHLIYFDISFASLPIQSHSVPTSEVCFVPVKINFNRIDASSENVAVSASVGEIEFATELTLNIGDFDRQTGRQRLREHKKENTKNISILSASNSISEETKNMFAIAKALQMGLWGSIEQVLHLFGPKTSVSKWEELNGQRKAFFN